MGVPIGVAANYAAPGEQVEIYCNGTMLADLEAPPAGENFDVIIGAARERGIEVPDRFVFSAGQIFYWRDRVDGVRLSGGILREVEADGHAKIERWTTPIPPRITQGADGELCLDSRDQDHPHFSARMVRRQGAGVALAFFWDLGGNLSEAERSPLLTCRLALVATKKPDPEYLDQFISQYLKHPLSDRIRGAVAEALWGEGNQPWREPSKVTDPVAYLKACTTRKAKARSRKRQETPFSRKWGKDWAGFLDEALFKKGLSAPEAEAEVRAKELLALLETEASPKQQDLLHLEIHGASREEAADALGIDRNTVDVR